MKVFPASLAAVLSLALALPARAQSLRGTLADTAQPSLISSDPLMRQILRKQLVHEDGGITATVRVGSGQALSLRVGSLDLPVSGAATALRAAPTNLPVIEGLKTALRSKNPAKTALEQLRKAERDGWEDSRRKRL